MKAPILRATATLSAPCSSFFDFHQPLVQSAAHRGVRVVVAHDRACAAHDVAARMRYGIAAMDDAARAVLAEVRKRGADGGLIAVDRFGRITMPFLSRGMKRAAVSSEMAAVVQVFEPET